MVKNLDKNNQYTLSGTSAPWYQGWDLTEEEKAVYRERSKSSAKAKQRSLIQKIADQDKHPINNPKLDPASLMPQRPSNGIRTLSLFSGGGGLDLGFDMAGFSHMASYEILSFAADTLCKNRPLWTVKGGSEGDVTSVDWRKFRGEIDVVHGGPPCQPFSTSGRQRGKEDARDMFPEFVRAVTEIRPKAFLAENVPGLKASKFDHYLSQNIVGPLSRDYKIFIFQLSASSFGVPQVRTRLFFVGFRNRFFTSRFEQPRNTHDWSHFKNGFIKKASDNQKELFCLSSSRPLLKCMGVREALGLEDIGYDTLSPTIRSTLTGPRHTTSILSSTSALRVWNDLKIWPNGVGLTRELAQNFPAKNGHFRLSVADCGIIQGFPESWEFDGPVYKALGQIGNAVPPPMAYWLATSLEKVLLASD